MNRSSLTLNAMKHGAVEVDQMCMGGVLEIDMVGGTWFVECVCKLPQTEWVSLELGLSR